MFKNTYLVLSLNSIFYLAGLLFSIWPRKVHKTVKSKNFTLPTSKDQNDMGESRTYFQKCIPITCGEYSEVDAILSNCRNYLTMEGKFRKLKILILKIYIVLFWFESFELYAKFVRHRFLRFCHGRFLLEEFINLALLKFKEFYLKVKIWFVLLKIFKY